MKKLLIIIIAFCTGLFLSAQNNSINEAGLPQKKKEIHLNNPELNNNSEIVNKEICKQNCKIGYIKNGKGYILKQNTKDVDYYIELFPNMNFTGSWYFFVNESSSLTCNWSENPSVNWLSITPEIFTAYPNNLAIKVDFNFIAPSQPGTYTTTIIDLDSNWGSKNITLVVTENPNLYTYSIPVNAKENQQYTYSKTDYAPDYFYWEEGGAYYYFNNLTLNYYEHPEKDWMNINPSSSILNPGNSVITEFNINIDNIGNYNLYTIRDKELYTYPTYYYFDVYCGEDIPERALGYNASSYGSVLPVGPIKFSLNNPQNVTSITDQSNLNFISGSTWANGLWYGTVYGDDILVTIDTINGNRNTIGYIGVTINGLSYDQSSNNLYGVDWNSGVSGQSSLYSINPQNGYPTFIGSTSNGELLINLACDLNGNLYSVDVYSDMFGMVNKSTGEFIPIGYIGFNANYSQDMEFDNNSGRCYMAAWNIDSGQGELRLVNIESGMSYLVDVFDGGMDVTGFAIPNGGGQWQCGDPFTDSRDGQTYNSVQIGEQCWMAENLNIGGMINGSEEMTDNSVIEKYCNDNSTANCETYGGLYQWPEMMQYTITPGLQGLCPSGWYLPTDVEWTTLTDFLGGQNVAGGKMKETGTIHWQSPNTGATNESGFTALPGGFRHTAGNFFNLTSYAHFWSSSELDNGRAWDRLLYYSGPLFSRDYSNKGYGLSVRCMKDETTPINQPPEPPSSPNPDDGAVNQSIEVDLSWSCVDPDGDPLTYDVYFGTEATPPQITTGQTETTYDPGILENNTEYFWKIVAHDDHSNTTEGSVWSFTTKDEILLGADFEAEPLSGNAPLIVQFTDLSTDNTSSWQWDFDNNGTIDSEEQNPEWTYNEPGIYAVSLTVSDGTNEDTETKEDYIEVTEPSTGVEPTGSGTEADPWQIATLDNLLWVSINSSSWSSVNYFIQIANIDATDTENWNGGEGFSPIGNNPVNFQGNYDGQNYSINGLYINRPTAYDQGLFGYSAGLIENVNLTNVNITGFDGVGALVGVSSVTTVSHCTSSGYVTGTENRIGGLAGESNGGWTQGYVTDCHSSCHVTGVDNVGGLVGQSSRSTISYCSGSGSVSGSEKVGGLVGMSTNSASITNSFSMGSVSGSSNNIGGLAGSCNVTAVNNCYSRSSVNGVSHVAGLVGYAGETNIWDCYSTGIVAGTGSYVGGLVGEIYWFASVDNSFWDYEASGIMSSPYGGTGKTTAEMQDVATFTNEATSGLFWAWDFVGNPNGDTGNDDYWNIDGFNNDGYPYLSYQYSSPLHADFSASNTTISLGDNIHFTDLSTGSPTTWEWDFQNDGTIDSYDQNPNWIYAVSGIYTVSLRVSDGIYYNFSNKNDYIIVVDCNPTMAFSPNPLDFGVNEIAPVQDTLSSWLKNTSNCQLYINSLFGLQPPLSYDTTGLSSASIMPGDSIEIQIILNKDFAAGTYTDTLIASNSTSQNIDLEDGLVAWYPFNGNANDESGNGHNGQISGDPQSVNDRFGNNNSAYDFDGNGDFITAGNWFTYQDFTISVWVKQDGLNSNYVDIIDNNHGYDNWAIQYNYDIDTYVFYVAPLGATAFTLPNSQWKHLVCIKDGVSLKTYMNGILQDEFTATSPTINYSNPYLNIARWGGGDRYFNGKIDDIRMYDRGLTEDEVEALYNENNGIEGYPQLIVQAELEYPVLIADFEADNVSVNLGEEIQFTDLSSGNPTSWQWDFDNDGSIDSEEQNPEWIYNEAGTYTVSLTVTDENEFTDTETKVDYINVSSQGEEQLIELSTGYSFVSTRIIPENPDFAVICDGILLNLDFARNTAGSMLRKIGPMWINGIGDWVTTEGYLFRMNNPDEMTISGNVIDPQTPILLSEGYQFISYLPENSIDALEVFDDVLGNLDFVRNSAGSMLRKIGPMWINSIGEMNPSEGYLVKMINPDELIYPGSANSCGEPFIDSRDGKTYNTVLIGEQCWMAENLNIGEMINGTEEMTNNGVIERYCQENNSANCDEYGGLYQWNEMMQYTTTQGVQGICPDNWHLPTDGEWTTVTNFLGGIDVAGGKMKEIGTAHWRSPNTGATNESGFTALPGGSRQTTGSMGYMGDDGCFWSSTEFNASAGNYRLLRYNFNNVGCYSFIKNKGYSVRCLQDNSKSGKSFSVNKNINPVNFNFEGGNAADPVYTIYIDGLQIGDEVAAFDEGKMIGSIVINSNNVFENDLAVFNIINSGQGYQAGNPIQLKIWNSFTQETSIAEYEMSDPYNEAYMQDVYPNEDGLYSVIKITKDVNNFANSSVNISIFPNPSEGVFNISVKGVSGKVQMKVIDVHGNDYRLLEIDGTNSIITEKLDLKELPAGVYFISFSCKDFSQVKKIVIQ